MKDCILIVDDEPGVRSALKRALSDEGCTVHTAESGPEGLRILDREPVKVVLSDERMPDMAGSEFLGIVRDRHPYTVRIVLTGQANVESAMRAINSGEIYRYLTKPWDDNDLCLTVRSAFEKYDLEAENRRLLQTVKRQALDIRLLEKNYPGISTLDRDGSGSLVIPDVGENELEALRAELDREFG